MAMWIGRVGFVDGGFVTPLMVNSVLSPYVYPFGNAEFIFTKWLYFTFTTAEELSMLGVIPVNVTRLGSRTSFSGKIICKTPSSEKLFSG